tara:strand:+ start:57 stop:893 length:837 start_codon:yes stop_codon:yes gene_type:complete
MAKTAKEKKKLKVPEFDEKTEKQLEQMAFLELRAKADPYVRDNPSARLALDLLERGVKIDGVGAGEILAGMRTGPEGFDTYTGKGFSGVMLPSEEYSDTRAPGFAEFVTAADMDKYAPGFEKVLQKQGIESLLPPEKGSTVYYDTGHAPEPDGTFPSGRTKYDTKTAQGKAMTVLAEELSHLGMRYLQKEKGQFTRMPLDEEETMMNYQQGRAAARRGVFAEPLSRSDYRFYQRSGAEAEKDKFKAVDKAAEQALKERGISMKAADPTIMERLLGMFN